MARPNIRTTSLPKFQPTFNPRGALASAAVMNNLLIPRISDNVRFFTDLDSSFQKYYVIPTWTASGDFYVKQNFTKMASSALSLMGNSGDTSNYIHWVNATSLAINIDNVVNSFTTTDLEDGKYHEIEVVRTSGSIEVFIDEASIGTGVSSATGDFIVDFLGANNTPGNYWTGISANVDLNGEHFYPIDEDWTENLVLHDTKTVLGSELWAQGDYVSTGSEGTFIYVATESTGISIGQNLLYEFTVTGLTAGQARLWVGNTLVEAVTANGVYTGVAEVLSSADTRIQIGNSQTNSGATFAVSIKEAAGYGTAVNITDADAKEYVFEEVRWTGLDQLVINPDFDSDATWSKGTGWSISGGNAIHTAPSTSNIGQMQGANLDEGDTVKCIYDSVSLSGGFYRALYGGLTGNLNTSNVIGLNTEFATWGSQVGNNFNIQAFTNAEAVISSIRLFKTLEIAT